MADSQSGKLFDQCIICLVRSRDLPDALIQTIQTCLEDNGATISEVKSDGTIKLEEVTHIISNTADFPQYNKASEHMIPVISSGWVKASLASKANKLAPLRSFTPDPRYIFSGLMVSCADIPTGDKDAIIGAVLAMGGQESSSLTKSVTHVVALTEEHPKCQEVRNRHLKAKIILPHWFDDCLKLGKKIDEKPYLLPNPDILCKCGQEDVKIPITTQIEGAVSVRPNFLPHPTDIPTSSRKLNVFNEKHVMLADDLHLNSRLRAIVEDLVQEGGGYITGAVHKANMYICHYREGKDYVIASKNGTDVGNLSWLFHLITHNEWTSPLRRLLHYPIPRDGIPGFKDARITLSNYGGDARIYLENLVIASGGEFTKSMKQDNTHLITARDTSEKCAAAREWNVNMINHLWMEESYAKCQVQSLTNPRYTHFPPRTNLGEIIGQTQFDPAILERLYFPEYPADSPDFVRKPRPVMQDKDQNVAVAQNVVRASSTRTRRSFGTPSRVVSAAVTPATNRILGGGKENETPSTTGSRGAKDRALSKLHDLGADMQLYEKEKNRKGPLWGGSRAANQIEKQKVEKENERQNSRKRSSSPAEEDAEVESDEETREVKRQKHILPPVEMRLLITGYKEWVTAPEKEERDRKKLRELGVLVTQDPLNCNYMAAPALVRTQKFLCALANGVTVLSTDFIAKCISSNSLVSPNKFLLKDTINEERFGLKIADSVKRAQSNKRRLLQGVTVYCTESITNGADTFKAIVESNGGMFHVYRGRGGAVIKPGKLYDDEEIEPVYLLSSSRPDEKRLWLKFEQMAREGNMEPRIVATEWLLDAAMSQSIKWNPRYLAANDV